MQEFDDRLNIIESAPSPQGKRTSGGLSFKHSGSIVGTPTPDKNAPPSINPTPAQPEEIKGIVPNVTPQSTASAPVVSMNTEERLNELELELRKLRLRVNKIPGAIPSTKDIEKDCIF